MQGFLYIAVQFPRVFYKELSHIRELFKYQSDIIIILIKYFRPKPLYKINDKNRHQKHNIKNNFYQCNDKGYTTSN